MLSQGHWRSPVSSPCLGHYYQDKGSDGHTRLLESESGKAPAPAYRKTFGLRISLVGMVASLLLPASHSGTRWEPREDLTPIPFNQQNLLERATGRLMSRPSALAFFCGSTSRYPSRSISVSERFFVTKTLGLFQGVQAAGEVSTG